MSCSLLAVLLFLNCCTSYGLLYSTQRGLEGDVALRVGRHYLAYIFSRCMAFEWRCAGFMANATMHMAFGRRRGWSGRCQALQASETLRRDTSGRQLRCCSARRCNYRGLRALQSYTLSGEDYIFYIIVVWDYRFSC